MAQADGVVANGTGSAVRSDINNQYAALWSNHSGSTEPSAGKVAYQFWADTNTNILKIRNSANNAWINLFTLAGGIDVDAASNFNEDVTFVGDSSKNAVWDKSDGALEFADNAKAVFGTGSDFEVYFDGSSAFIKESGASQNLLIQNDDITVIEKVDGTNQAKFTGGGSIELYFNGSLKFATDDDGIQVTGMMQAHKNISDAYYKSHAQHVVQTDLDDIATFIMESSANSTPYGAIIAFTDASPDDNTRYFLDCGDATARRMVVFSDGDVWTSDAGTLTSDETLKENIVDATPKLEDLKKLKVRNFNWKSSFHPEKSKQKQLGFIAQEVEEVFPALVAEYDVAPHALEEDHVPVMKKSIKQAWDPIIIKAMQELIAKVETLETKVAALEAK